MPRDFKLQWLFYSLSLILNLYVVFLIKIDTKKDSINAEIVKTIKVVLKGREIRPALVERLKARQVVNNELTGDEKRPDRSSYLGEKNQTYKEQTIPGKIAPFKAGSQSNQDEALRRRQKYAAKNLKLSDLLVKGPGDIETYAIKKQNNHKTFLVDMVNTQDASNSDYIKDVKIGDATNLNTQEYKFWGFYNRMRLRLEPAWEKLLDERIRRYFTYGRKIIIADETITLIKITLDEEGNVFRLKVLRTSGIAEIDNIAIDAITQAGPFPSVPREMLKERLTEIEWGFVVKP